jgi:hypothetical protein
MTKEKFLTECYARYIYPKIALENEELQDALVARDDDKVIEILDNEF